MEKERKVIITTGDPGKPLSKQLEEMKDILTIEEYEEERKRQIVEHEKAEQLKQFYNSEQWKDVIEAIERTYERIKEAVTPVIEAAAKVAKELYRGVMKVYSADPEIKKCYGIYKRTKKRKDQKEANKQNNKNNRKEIY